MEKNDIEYFRINRYCDSWCDKVPRFMGWGLYDLYYKVKNKSKYMYQKIVHDVADEECWSLDSTLTRYILPRLRHFKKMKRYTYPCGITAEEWEHTLDEIIWTFDYLDNDEKYNPIPKSIMPPTKSSEEFLNYFNREKTESEKLEFDMYMQKCNELENRSQKGLQLFAKYYNHLWD